jgi:uncharacterized protein
MIKDHVIPKIQPELYSTKIGQRLVIYNPLSNKNVLVMNKEAQNIFRLLDNKKSIKKLFHSIEKIQVSKMDFFLMLRQLEDNDIISLSSIPKKTVIKKPTNISAWVHMTNQCNLRCTYCYIPHTPKKMTLIIGKKAINQLFITAERHALKTITLSYSGGESILKFDIIKNLVHYSHILSRKHHIEVFNTILTNGTLLDDSIARIMKKEKVRVLISLDGLHQNNATRRFPNGKESFTVVERAIHILQHYKIPFRVTVVLSKNNIEHLPELFEYLLQKNIHFNINFIKENPCYDTSVSLKNEKVIQGLLKGFTAIKQNFNQNHIFDIIKVDRINLTELNHISCGIGTYRIIIDTDGSISNCQYMLEEKIGSIEDPDIFTLIKEQKLVEKLSVNKKKECSNCLWRYKCSGGCPYLIYEKYGTYAKRSPYCSVYKKIIPELIKLEAERIIALYTI